MGVEVGCRSSSSSNGGSSSGGSSSSSSSTCTSTGTPEYSEVATGVVQAPLVQ